MAYNEKWNFDLPYNDDIYVQPTNDPTFTDTEYTAIDAFCGDKDLLGAINHRVKLSRNERLVLAAYLNEAREQLTLKEIAGYTGLSIEGVRKIILRIIKKTRESLDA